MKLFKKLAAALLTAVLAVSMLTACSSSAPSAPSEPSNPGTSQGGTGELPENPGETGQPGGSEENPGENPDDTPAQTPAQKTWANSMAKAYLDAQGVTPENYYVSNKQYSAEMVYYINGTPCDGDDDYFVDLAVSGSNRLLKLRYARNIITGFYTDGTNFYGIEDDSDSKEGWKKIVFEGSDPFYDYTSTDVAKLNLDAYLYLAPVPKVSEILDFKSATSETGTTETVTLKNGAVYTYEFDITGALEKTISDLTAASCTQALFGYGGMKLTLKKPEIVPASGSAPFPTTFSTKSFQNYKENQENETNKDFPTSWADSKTKAYLTRNNITKDHFYIKAENKYDSEIYIYEVSGESKSIQIQSTQDDSIKGYAYADGVYTQYAGSTTNTTESVLRDTVELALAKKFFEEIEAFGTIPSDVEITAFRADGNSTGAGDERFITTDGKRYAVWLDSDDSIRSASIYLPNGNDIHVSIKEFKRTSTGTTAMFDMLTMLANFF